MSTPKKVWLLVNDVGGQPLDTKYGDSSRTDWRYCDIDLDSHGTIRTVDTQQLVVQSTLKNIFTERESATDGLGTNIYSIVGEKDVVVRRVSLLMDITMSIMAQKRALDSQATAQDLSPDDLIATMTQMSVTDDDVDPRKTKVKLALQTNAGVQTTIGVL